MFYKALSSSLHSASCELGGLGCFFPVLKIFGGRFLGKSNSLEKLSSAPAAVGLSCGFVTSSPAQALLELRTQNRAKAGVKRRSCPVHAHSHSTAARKGLGDFMAFLANEAEICIAVIAGRGGDLSRGFAGSAEAEAGAARGRLLSCAGHCVASGLVQCQP